MNDDRMTQRDLESYLWGAAVLLRGLVDAGDYKGYVFPLLFYKRVSDVWDEDYTKALEDSGDEGYAAAVANDRFSIPDGAHWDEVRETAKDVGRAIQGAMRSLEAANPEALAGIFGDGGWTNKERLSDATLKNLLEHFSRHTLSPKNVPEDELGNAYEYLIKKFADDSGHTAQEFYTNRTVVHLMTQMLDPRPGESIYDPTCGTGGMLISALAEVKRKGGEHRTLGLYGQERNHMTASIARMNLALHGIEDYAVARGDTLADPQFSERDALRTFDVVLANPPYSIKRWNRDAFGSDPWGRNFLGTPPQGRADYAFFQHILKSMDSETGRCAVLFPHGVLFRNEEAEMRRKLVESDLLECVLGLGPNLFLQLPDGSLRGPLPQPQARRAPGQGLVYRRRERGRQGAQHELLARGAPGAYFERLPNVYRRARFRPRRHPGSGCRAWAQPQHPALRQAQSAWGQARGGAEPERALGCVGAGRARVLGGDGRCARDPRVPR